MKNIEYTTIINCSEAAIEHGKTIIETGETESILLNPIIIIIALVLLSDRRAFSPAEYRFIPRPQGGIPEDLPLTRKIYAQIQANSFCRRYGLPEHDYNRFPANHPGHLTPVDIQNLTDILCYSYPTRLRYREGSSIGVIYIRNSYNRPRANYYILSSVFLKEIR